MRFQVVAGQNIFSLNPGMKAIPAFQKLSANQMNFVALVADVDRDNPVRTLPLKNRRHQAALISGYHMEPDGSRPDRNMRDIIQGKIANVEAAIEEYRKFQFDEEQANLDAIDHQINEARSLLLLDKIDEKDLETTVKNISGAIKLAGELDRLVTVRDKMKRRVAKNKIEPPPTNDGTPFVPQSLPLGILENEEDDKEDEDEVTNTSTIDQVMAR